MTELFFFMLCAHALCDYPLQGDFLARGKNHNNPIPGIPWYQCLVSHALIHGGAVALITGSLALGVAETVVHTIIDWMKCEGLTNLDQDQAMHVVCKLVWASIAVTL